jgi:hypothetical protein
MPCSEQARETDSVVGDGYAEPSIRRTNNLVRKRRSADLIGMEELDGRGNRDVEREENSREYLACRESHNDTCTMLLRRKKFPLRRRMAVPV